MSRTNRISILKILARITLRWFVQKFTHWTFFMLSWSRNHKHDIKKGHYHLKNKSSSNFKYIDDQYFKSWIHLQKVDTNLCLKIPFTCFGAIWYSSNVSFFPLFLIDYKWYDSDTMRSISKPDYLCFNDWKEFQIRWS